MNSYLLAAALLSVPLAGQNAATPASPSPTAPPPQLRILPAAVQLDSARDLQSLIAFSVRGDGVVHALRQEVAWSMADATLAAVEPTEGGVRLRPLHDGSTEVIARWEGRQHRRPEQHGLGRPGRHRSGGRRTQEVKP